MAPTLGNINPAMIGPGDIVVNATLGQSIETNVTTIDGGKIRTNTLNADRIIAGTSITSPLINGGTINGGTINGVNIVGSVIKSSWIDYSSTGALTNWKYYGPVGNTDGYPEVPVLYEANFAHDSQTGNIVTDSDGYVRLPTVTGSVVPGETTGFIACSGVPTWTTSILTIPLFAYNSYEQENTNRLLSDSLNYISVKSSDVVAYLIGNGHIQCTFSYFDGTTWHNRSINAYNTGGGSGVLSGTGSFTLGSISFTATGNYYTLTGNPNYIEVKIDTTQSNTLALLNSGDQAKFKLSAYFNVDYWGVGYTLTLPALEFN